MAKQDVLVMVQPRPVAMERLEERYALHRYDQAADKMAFLAEHGPVCTGIVTNGHEPLTRDHLQHLSRLEIVTCSSAGYESMDLDALRDRNIAFTNTSDVLRDDVADVALMLTLAARRELVAGHDYVRSGDWGRKGMYPLLSSMKGKKAGILGLGAIGSAIARRFEPMGLEIGYAARGRKPVSYAYFDSPAALAEWSDILVVIIPGGPETEALVDAEVINALGPTGTLINVARGSVVDEAALIAALTSGRLGSAGLDVYLNEPNPDPALTGLPNVTLYPHHASGTVETRDAMAMSVVDNLSAWYSGAPLLSPVTDLRQAGERASA